MLQDGSLGFSEVYFQGHKDAEAMSMFVQLSLTPANFSFAEVTYQNRVSYWTNQLNRSCSSIMLTLLAD